MSTPQPLGAARPEPARAAPVTADVPRLDPRRVGTAAVLDLAATAPAGADSDTALARSRAVLGDLFGPVADRQFAVRFWTGDEDAPPGGGAPPAFTLVLCHAGALRRMLLPPSELRLGEAFVRGDYDVVGDLEAATGLADVLRVRLSRPGMLVRITRRLLALPAPVPASAPRGRLRGTERVAPRHSRRRDRVAIQAHYDVGNDFYALWLDRRMVYSCAYFPTGRETLDAAQAAKLELICRKLRLRPDDVLLDVGCGWGGLVQYAAEQFGVRAFGITLSEAQAALVREQIAAAGLGERCQVAVLDYRDLDERVPFDKIVSVGMFEHVGPDRLGQYFGKVSRLLRPGGLFLNHGIVAAPGHPRAATPAALAAITRRLVWRDGQFIDRYVFPDGELVAVAEAVAQAERCGLEARDVESLREHYAATLRHWGRRLESARADAVRLVGEETYRVWRLYMAGSAHGFASGRLGLAQVLFAKPHRDGSVDLPPTRADLYGPATPATIARPGVYDRRGAPRPDRDCVA
jgi:cyclopropane-fatty-acyl-phospholipid synthase